MPEQQLSAPIRYSLQVMAYVAFAAALGVFSTWPAYRLRGDTDAVLKLSFSHSAQLAKPCRARSARSHGLRARRRRAGGGAL